MNAILIPTFGSPSLTTTTIADGRLGTSVCRPRSDSVTIDISSWHSIGTMYSFERWSENLIARLVNGSFRKDKPGPREDGALGHLICHEGIGASFAIPSDVRTRHLYVLGATGSGKTNLLAQLIEKDLRDGVSAAVLDLRGDLIDRIMPLAETYVHPDSVYLIDLRRPQLSSGLNPFQSKADAYSAALHVHSILKSAADSWGVQLDETLRCTLIALSNTRSSLVEIPRFLTNGRFRSDVLAELTDPHVLAFFERFSSLSLERQNSWVLPVLNKVSPFLSHPSIRAILSDQPPIDLANVLDSRGSLLLVGLAADRLHGLAGTFGCLVVSAIENAVMRRVDVPEASRNPVHLYLDEFENFQSPAFESIIAEGRRFRLGLTLSHQNLHQLDTRLRHNITNNAATRIYFRTGHVDSKELGSELEQYGVRGASESLMHLATGNAYVVGSAPDAQLVAFGEARHPTPNPERHASLLQTLRSRAEPAIPALNPPDEPRVPCVKHVRKPRAAKPREGRNED